MFICGGPCHLFSFKQSSGDLIFLLLFSYGKKKNKYACVWTSNIVDITVLNLSSLKLQSAPSAEVIKGGRGVKKKSFSINSSSLGPRSTLLPYLTSNAFHSFWTLFPEIQPQMVSSDLHSWPDSIFESNSPLFKSNHNSTWVIKALLQLSDMEKEERCLLLLCTWDIIYLSI